MDTELDDDAGLDNEQAAAFLGVALQTLAVWRSQGRGPEFYKVDRRVRYAKQALEEFRSQHCPHCCARLPSRSDAAVTPARPAAPSPDDQDLGVDDEMARRRQLASARSQLAAAAALRRLRQGR